MKIPKIIWQTYKNSNVPTRWASSPSSLKALHPNWSYRFMTDEDNYKFVAKYYPQYLSLYDRLGKEIKPICRVDMVRCLYLHKFGGVYLDMDYKIVKEFDTLFTGNNDLYLVKTSNLNGLTNSFFGSMPGCPFWIKCIEKMIHRLDHCPWYIFGDLRVLWTTGPGMLTDVANEYTQPFVTIPYKLGHPCNICDHYLNRVCTSEESYVEELEGSSWTSPSTQLFYFGVCRWKDVLLIVTLILLLLVFYFVIYNR